MSLNCDGCTQCGTPYDDRCEGCKGKRFYPGCKEFCILDFDKEEK